MTNKPSGHAGTKPVMRNGSLMRTLDPTLLANAGSVSRQVRRRGLTSRTVILLLSFLGMLVVIAILAIATSGGWHA